MFANYIVEHRRVLEHYLKDYLYLNIAKVVSSYSYHLQGKSHILGNHEALVLSSTTLPDGRIATGSVDGTIKIWDPYRTDSADISTLYGHKDAVQCLASFPDGKIISGSADKSLKVWNIDNGSYHCNKTFWDDSCSINCVIILSDE